MIGVIAIAKLKDGAAEEYERVFRALREDVHAKEPGCLFYELGRDPKDPGRYIGTEFFKDQAAFDAHCAADHFLAAFPKLQACWDGEPHIEMVLGIG